jgi:glycosyltransferase involved in cell wall biosynthesis
MVAAVPISLTAFMAPHVRALARTMDLTLVASAAPESGAMGPLTGVRFHQQPISRRVSVMADVRALVALWRFFRRERFDAVQSITPKAGLLTMIAGRFAGVPTRVHWFTGQVWATRSGAARLLLKGMDRLLAASATHLLADSVSQREFLEREGVVRPGRVTVLAEGSVCGVDTARFKPDPAARRDVRAASGIAADAVVALYLGRLNREKGLPELASAFGRVAPECPSLHLLVVGPDEGDMAESIRTAAGGASKRVHVAGETARPEAFMAAADFFVLPSHREGFGSSVIEAAACEVPAIATSIYGLTDAVADGESGVLVPVRDVVALAGAMRQLATEHDLRRRMGAAARLRVERLFTEERLTAALGAFYQDMHRSPEAFA